jgi:transposase InsO family protein
MAPVVAYYPQVLLWRRCAVNMRTTFRQRREFYERHLRGETYREIADSEGVSKECVRYWCRRQRDGGSCGTIYRRRPARLLGRFHPLVRYCILRLRLEHPRWGPNRIREKLKKRPSQRGLRLPSESSIGRYLHQWHRFRRRPKKSPPKRKRPRDPAHVHQRWQIDFKVGIALNDGNLVNLHTVRDPVGEACIGAFVFPAGQVGQKAKRPAFEQVRSVLRTCFARWGTLPEEVQTDNELTLTGQPQDTFPSRFTLWLKGLGIDHLVIRPGKPTDNAEVERCHRTVNDYAIVGNEEADIAQLQHILDQAVDELNFELPSRAEGCGGVPPVVAHPELLQPRRPFRPEHELALFDLERVDAHLATFTWKRKVGKTGQITIGGQHQCYSVGRAYARQQVLVRFDPTDRHFVFFDSDDPEEEIGRRPARDLDVSDLTGLAVWPTGLGLQQLPLPLPVFEGVNC